MCSFRAGGPRGSITGAARQHHRGRAAASGPLFGGAAGAMWTRGGSAMRGLQLGGGIMKNPPPSPDGPPPLNKALLLLVY
ncbi:hypothetical protein CgunFtcFv8_015994 [Champsocephalus gunnari]|uniref:Uncharacterized protein n=1 Tax=Champsocephalus gunnari TaxID=52237 RepID=A0AAN8C6T8_CHAGU|nr:hypothetical protein CgunFtcFv8_015994 [Champsocephalus gunnari]